MYENIIAIPYRDREQHLEHYIEHTVPLLQKHLPNSKVVVVEQAEGKLFNRGALLNIVFKEYENKTKYFFTHDVDIIPIDADVIERIYCNNEVDIYRIFSAHKYSLGGIIKVKHDVMFDINGFPNNIWGWGIEDRALYYRSKMKKYVITENKEKKLFRTLHHSQSNRVQYKGDKKIISDKYSEKRINALSLEKQHDLINDSGLNNLEYTVLERKNMHEMVEIIKVEI